jgi:hypothetical protein
VPAALYFLLLEHGMAKVLDNFRIKMGRLVRVANLSPRFGQNEVMYALNVEDQDGGNERWLLFTELEICKLSEVSGITLHKPGRLYYHHKIGKRGRSLLCMMKYGGAVGFHRWNVALPDSLLKRAEKRAQENPEDIPEKSKIVGLLD